MTNEGYYIGSGLKFRVDINVAGFDQEADNYTIDFYCGDKVLHFPKNKVKQGADGSFYLPVETDSLEPGQIKIVVTAYVPDSDFDSGHRKEIAVKKLKWLKHV